MPSQDDLPTSATFISNDDSPLLSANNDERRIPKSISWLLLILVIVLIQIWYASHDLLPSVSEYTGQQDDGSVVASRQHNITGRAQHNMRNIASNKTWMGRNHSISTRSNHSNDNMQTNSDDSGTNATIARLHQHQQNRSEALLVSKVTGPPLHKHDANENETSTLRNHSLSTTPNITEDEIIANRTCSFCQGEGRIFNPSIRLQDGYTCASIKQEAAALTAFDPKCKAFQIIENSCCPTANWSNFWEKDNQACFHLRNICHAPNNEKWFYDRSVFNSSQVSGRHRRQPTIEYDRDSMHNAIIPDYRIHFNVSATTTYGGNMADCPYSLTPHHVVSQSAYNHMIGEFYVRQMIGLNYLMKDHPPESDQDIQMYIHIPAEKSRLFDGHRLFMGALPHNGRVQNFLSLVQGKESCECYQTLAFCGYNRNTTEMTNGKGMKQTFDLAGSIPYNGIENSVWCARLKEEGLNCTTFNDFRQDLLVRYATKDPLLPQKISQYKHQMLLNVSVTSEDLKNESDWKIVGLAERKSRRVWLNIDDAIKACESFRHQKVVCIKVNVEQTSSPEEQLLMHSSLDALVGIHGAQLTQGVLLPRHGYILELLPWIPDWYHHWGGWVATTDVPTPVGIMFYNTDLNHLGYALGRASVPLCKDVKNQTELKDCLAKDDPVWRWDRRNFDVEPDVITKLISSFVLQNSTHCESMKRSAVENDFVLYNAYCSNNVENEFSTQHYYRES